MTLLEQVRINIGAATATTHPLVMAMDGMSTPSFVVAPGAIRDPAMRDRIAAIATAHMANGTTISVASADFGDRMIVSRPTDAGLCWDLLDLATGGTIGDGATLADIVRRSDH